LKGEKIEGRVTTPAFMRFTDRQAGGATAA
jgi:hypothetical protein